MAHRLSIEDGAYFKGSVDLKRSERKINTEAAKSAKPDFNHSQPQPVAVGAVAGKA